MRLSSAITLVALWAGAVMAEAPQRVVTMNLCADQLAMMLAAPGQLVSVSSIARDPRASAMREEAQEYPVNNGLAEEVYLLAPDLVIAGSGSTPVTTDMLERLGINVVRFEPAYSLEAVRERIVQMGELLGQEAEAAQLLAGYDARLAALAPVGPARPRTALYAANGYTAGRKSLAGQVLLAAGLSNVAEELGYTHAGNLPLELLVMADPDMLMTTTPYPFASRSEEILDHPALEYLAARSGTGRTRDANWVCGTPHILQAVEALIGHRREFLEGQAQ